MKTVVLPLMVISLLASALRLIACHGMIPSGSYIIKNVSVGSNSYTTTDTAGIPRWWTVLRVDGADVKIWVLADSYGYSAGNQTLVGLDTAALQLSNATNHLAIFPGSYCVNSSSNFSWVAVSSSKTIWFEATNLDLDSLVKNFCPRVVGREWQPEKSLLGKLDDSKRILPVLSSTQQSIAATRAVHETVFYGTLQTDRLMVSAGNMSLSLQDISDVMEQADSFVICSGFAHILGKSVNYLNPSACVYTVTIGNRVVTGPEGHTLNMVIVDNDTLVVDPMFGLVLSGGNSYLSLREGVHRVLTGGTVFWEKIPNSGSLFLQNSPCLNASGQGHVWNGHGDIFSSHDSLYVVRRGRSFPEYLLGFEDDYVGISQANALGAGITGYPVYTGDTSQALNLLAHVSGIYGELGCENGSYLYQELLEQIETDLATIMLALEQKLGDDIFPTVWNSSQEFPNSWKELRFFSVFDGTEIPAPQSPGIYLAQDKEGGNLKKILVY